MYPGTKIENTSYYNTYIYIVVYWKYFICDIY